jgi:sortase A
MKKRKNKKTLFTVLGILLLCTALYLSYIYYPLIRFKFNGNNLKETSENQHPITSESQAKTGDVTKRDEYKSNTLIIPKIGVEAEILEGKSLQVLSEEEGVWREPQTSIPTRGSNMVVAGHRLQFLPPNTNTFYLLPELQEGDTIIIYWEGEQYNYEVKKAFESEVWTDYVYEKTNNTTVTLYTCTPLETAHRRYVVRGEIIH